MSNRIDQLFKNKLGDHSLTPSEEAWARVQAGLSKKNNLMIYWRAAAVFLLTGLLVSAWYLIQPVEIKTQQIAQSVNPPIAEPSNQTFVDKVATESNTVTDIEDTKSNKEVINTKNSTTSAKDIAIVSEIQQPLSEPSTEVEPVDISQSITVVEPAVSQEKPIVIEFSLPAVEEKNSSTLVAANTENEGNTGIMKFLETARDVKNGDAEFGNSLRDIKNDLFALDFKKDKTRRN